MPILIYRVCVLFDGKPNEHGLLAAARLFERKKKKEKKRMKGMQRDRAAVTVEK